MTGRPARIKACPARPGDVQRTFADVTHSREVASVAERVIHVRDGQIHDGLA